MERARLSKLLLAAATATFLGAAAVATAQPGPADPATPPPAWKAKNLQVLPADMARPQVIAVMKNFSTALGVECSFCHVESADGKLDPAADDKKEKASARWMMKMVAGLNEQFHVKPGDAPGVTCYTCHRGSPHPLTAAPPADPAKAEPHKH